MNKKLILILFGLIFSFTGNIFAAGSFSGSTCPASETLTQNLKAPRSGTPYVKNGRYHWYTKKVVREADILQRHLNRLGFNAGKVDGIIGPNTKGAILRMQKFLGTKQDGYVGPKTRKLLNNSCGSVTNQKSNSTEVSRNYSGDLKVLHSETAVREFLKKNTSSQRYVSDSGLLNSIIPRDELVIEASVATFDAPQLKSASGANFSETNTQVSGVDESDIVKTDGKYIYTISAGKKIFIVDAENPKEMKKVSEITASEDENILSIYLFDKKLIVISNMREKSTRAEYLDNSKLYSEKKIAYYPQNNFSRVEIYNISNPKKPTKEKTFDFEGRSRQSRISNGHLYLLTNKYFYNDSIITPMVRVDGAEISKTLGSEFYYIDSPQLSQNILSINSINLKKTNDISSKKILMPNTGNIYVSTDNFYITHNKYMDRYKIYTEIENDIFEKVLKDLMSKEDLELIEKIQNIDSKILSSWDKERKIKTVYDKYFREFSKSKKENIKEETSKIVLEKYKKLKKEFEKTRIEKFSLDGTNVKPTASGEVSGFALNQFSMSQIDGNFFIATTNNRSWLPWQIRNIVDESKEFESENNLYSLDKDLKNLDSVEGPAKGERIQSVRFVDNNAYLVTFKQIDPLFNIDISNPKNMKLLGELKIEGFSSYLHPVFENRLIGIGHDVKIENGRTRNSGLKVTLFDISRNKPREIKSIVLEGSGTYSEALHNHKAVLVKTTGENHILAFPATLQKNYDYRNRENVVAIFDISKDNISKKDFIDFGVDWKDNVKRALTISENIYGISNNSIKSFSLADEQNLGKVFFGEIPSTNYPIIPVDLENIR